MNNNSSNNDNGIKNLCEKCVTGLIVSNAPFTCVPTSHNRDGTCYKCGDTIGEKTDSDPNILLYKLAVKAAPLGSFFRA